MHKAEKYALGSRMAYSRCYLASIATSCYRLSGCYSDPKLANYSAFQTSDNRCASYFTLCLRVNRIHRARIWTRVSRWEQAAITWPILRFELWDTCCIKVLEPVSEFNLARDFTILEPIVITCNLHWLTDSMYTFRFVSNFTNVTMIIESQNSANEILERFA